ncbi:protein kinase [Streptomyces sp. NPDC101227]|uniref:protein kinase domain-containing protein n=1 Tax=Streptomyces sp. NPDC101227 TaxID=3366136 RepID=UPI00381D7E8A
MTVNGGNGFDLSGSGAEPLAAEDPRRIGSIPLVGRLGSGGMGRVYLGIASGRYAAVKQVLPYLAEDEEFLRHFGHELDNLSRLPVEVTAPLLASDRAARPPWFATSYIPGLPLSEAVRIHDDHLPADALWLLLREAAAGLKAVHALDMVHRDLKPSNVMLTLDGLTLIDFGVARAADQSRLTKTGMIVGTPAYMSPEQAAGKRQLSGATDVFALGSLVAYAAGGRPPFGDGGGLDMLYRIVHDQPDLQPVRDLDPDLAAAVASCLDKDPEGRPTAAELLALATDRGPSATRSWPSAISDLLSARATFAATVQPAPEPEAPPARTLPAPPPEPAQGGKDGDDRDAGKGGKDAEATPPAAPAPTTAPAAPERKRRRTLLAVVPVVVVAAGAPLAMRLLPFTAAPQDNPQANPPSSATAPLHPAPSSSDAAASGGTKPGKSRKQEKQGKRHSASPDHGKDGSPAGNGGTGASSASGGGSDAHGGTDGSSGSSGSSASGGSGSSGGTSPKPPASGTYRLKNGNNGDCLTVLVIGNATAYRSCADDSSSRWTFKPASNGTYTLVNERTGGCLSGGMPGNDVMTVTCGQGDQRWDPGSGGTLRSTFNDQCLDLGSQGSVTTATCDSGKASQRWSKL